MERNRGDRYCEGYIAGYLDGVRDGRNGKEADFAEGDMAALPVRAMDVSARARNCLSAAGCGQVADILALDARTVATMRNLGVKTAAEIAHWLDGHGIRSSVWARYL